MNASLAAAAIRARMTKKKLHQADLADVAQVEDLMRTFELYFQSQEHVEVLSPAEHSAMRLLDEEIGDDAGVDAFKGFSEKELMALLRFDDGRPAHWCALRCRDPAVTTWDEAHKHRYERQVDGSLPADVHGFSLLWHQLVGVAAMGALAWTAQPDSKVPGMLLCDGVGVGKTAQVMGLISLVQQVWVVESGGGHNLDGKRPPLLGEQRFRGGRLRHPWPRADKLDA